MSESPVLETILHHLHSGKFLSLFLDYDGTLVPIAPTPEEAIPDKPLLELLAQLSKDPLIRLVIVSGRPLKTLKAWLPVHRIALAGIYGAEIQVGSKIVLREIPVDQCRLTIAKVQENWRSLLNKHDGFFLEDKGLAIALHARRAKIDEARFVLEAARNSAIRFIDSHPLRLLDGDRFLEVAPITANKGLAVEWFLNEYLTQHNLPIYFGDDNKDEEAFRVIRHLGGVSIAVGNDYPLLQADEHLASPKAVRDWLRTFISIR